MDESKRRNDMMKRRNDETTNETSWRIELAIRRVDLRKQRVEWEYRSAETTKRRNETKKRHDETTKRRNGTSKRRVKHFVHDSPSYVWSINDSFVLQNWPKVPITVAFFFSKKRVEKYARIDELCQKLRQKSVYPVKTRWIKHASCSLKGKQIGLK